MLELPAFPARSLGGSTMFDRLFQNPCVLARQRNGPLAEERRRYLAHCAEQQMSRRTFANASPVTLWSSPRPCAWPSGPVNSSPVPRSRPKQTAGSIVGPSQRRCGRSPITGLFHGPCRPVADFPGAVATARHSSTDRTPITSPSLPTTCCGSVGCRPELSRTRCRDDSPVPCRDRGSRSSAQDADRGPGG